MQFTMKFMTRSLPATLLFLALPLVLIGCGIGSSSSTNNNITLNGTVTSGSGTPLAIAGATVSIYRAQENPTAPIAEGTSDNSGNFVISVPADASGSIYYAVARKGSNIEMMALLGTALPRSVVINELTTVGSAYAMAQFFQNNLVVGPNLSLQIAAGMAENLVAAQTGTPSTVIQASPNADETNTWRALGSLANMLAACVQAFPNACTTLFTQAPSLQSVTPTTTLQAMINIARNPGANVSALFTLSETAIASGYAPSLTAQQGPASANPFQKLDAWTLAVKVNATGSTSCPFGGPGNLVFDQNGYAWITNNVVQGTTGSASCQIVLKPNGQPADGANGTPRSPIIGGGILGQGFGIGIDTRGHIWSGNFGWGGVNPIGSVSKFTATGTAVSPAGGYVVGTDKVQGTISDQQNNIWLASYGNNSIIVLRDGNPAAAFPPYVDANVGPFDIAIANDSSGWVTYTGSSTVSKFTLGGSGPVLQFTRAIGAGEKPKGVALDSQGNAWVGAASSSAVYAFSPTGAPLGVFGGRGLDGPWGVSVDAKDNVWVANFGQNINVGVRYSLVRLCGATVANCPPGKVMGDAISPPSGYTLPSAGSQVLLNSGDPLYGPGQPPSYRPLMRITSANMDMAGNVWAANNWKPEGIADLLSNPGGDGMVIFVGLGAPTRAPTLGQPGSP